MAHDENEQEAPADPAELARNMARIAEQSQRLIRTFMARNSDGGVGMGDPLNIGGAFLEMTARMMADPAKIMRAQMDIWQDYAQLWQRTTQRLLGQEDVEPMAVPKNDDRRFRHAEWDENAVFDFIKQSYLLTSRWMTSTVKDVEGLDDKTAHKVAFYTRQFADAMAPSNFVMTNPEVLRATIESKGENLVAGLENLLDDLERGKGIKMTDEEAFEVGGNLAITPGQVVYRNDLIELIQYEPTTKQVHEVPLLIVPPWINKYYIFDMRPENSFVKWATEQGLTVFIVSWVNPDERLAEKSFEDYMREGILDAITAIGQTTGAAKVNLLSLCLGGTLSAATLAYMAAKRDSRVKSATFIASQVDFSEPGDLAVFIDEEQLTVLEQRMADQGGYLDGSSMASTFNLLRANDLIWSFVVNNYLLGRDPFPFDLLFWNADSTRMPGGMHSFYLRNMYQENRLVKPGGIVLADVPIDLDKISVPTYIVGTKEDHIAPWKSVYRATGIFKGKVRFVLGASGHIAGVTNAPPDAKYGHWTNDDLPQDPDAWLEGAEAKNESWWVDWKNWIAKQSGKKVAARKPADGKLKPLGPAPGTYVVQK